MGGPGDQEDPRLTDRRGIGKTKRMNLKRTLRLRGRTIARVVRPSRSEAHGRAGVPAKRSRGDIRQLILEISVCRPLLGSAAIRTELLKL
jgi:hypothetical protein